MRTRIHPFALAASLALPAALALTGCAAADDPGEGTADGPIAVRAWDTTCEVSRTEALAGTVEFTITNSGTQNNEFYVYAEGDRIMGEVENITPGLTRTILVELDPGTYQAACKPGMVGDDIRAVFTVTGTSAGPKATTSH